MKELKILLIIVVLTLVGYYGIDIYAHHEMYGNLPKPDFHYLDLEDKYIKGDPKKGKELFKGNCQSCHSLKAENLNAMMDTETAQSAFNVVPPDLSNIGAMVAPHFLFNFIKNPQNATKNPKFAMPPMSQLTDQHIADIVAYLQSVAKKDFKGKDVLTDACTRCHSIKYQKIDAFTDEKHLIKYLGKVPPDLSLKGKSKTREYLEAFINNPQSVLPGTSMPRLGLTEEATNKVINYLEQISDPHKDERKKIGIWALIYANYWLFCCHFPF
jgi:ubiquinol-cytochrome c reductase cytochrome c1 subunit